MRDLSDELSHRMGLRSGEAEKLLQLAFIYLYREPNLPDVTPGQADYWHNAITVMQIHGLDEAEIERRLG
jgi:hypothetical protein